MKYTKLCPQDTHDSDPWHTWLITSAHSGLEYNLLFWTDRLEVEFYDLDRAEEFAQEFGL
jgi:hypothetical protein